MPETEPPSDVSPPSGRRRRLKTAFVIAAALAWLIGSAVRLSVRDAFPLSAPIFYALPVPILVIAGSIAARSLWRLGRRRATFVFSLLIAVQFGHWINDALRLQTDFRKDSTRFLFWNVCRGNLGYSAIMQQIAAESPDIVALAEATQDGQKAEFWESQLPGYSATCLGGGMVLLTSDKSAPIAVEEIDKGQVPEQLRYRIVSLRLGDQPLTVLIADVKSAPLNFRRPAFERIAELTDSLDGPPLIVAGDFNTPVDSVHVDLMRRRLTNAFEVSGVGYRETWPVVFPVLSLDQIWGDHRIHWHRCMVESSLRSDHRMLIGEFTVRE